MTIDRRSAKNDADASQVSAAPRRRFETVVTAVIVAAALGFMLVNLRPWLWVLDTTPSGGDLGAHVWSPAYLRDVLLPEWRLTGWSHDWYAGFPAFTFYMVIPSLLVVIVEAGLSLPVNLFAHLAAVLGASLIVQSLSSRSLFAAAALVVMQVLDRLDGRAVRVPMFGDIRYNDLAVDRFLAAALPVVVGLWAWRLLRAPTADDRDGGSRPGGSLGGLRLGGAPLSDFRLLGTVTVASVAGLITPMPYGVALKLVAIAGVVALPAAAYGMARLGGMAFPGPALAAAGTLPFIFDRSFNIYGGNLMSTMAGEFAYSLGLAAAVTYAGVAAKGMATGRHQALGGILLALVGLTHLFSAFFALAVTAALIAVLPWHREALRRRLRWTAVTGALAAALSAWWVLPFWWNRGFLNDMGWGKERRYLSSLWSRTSFDYDFLVNDPPLQLFAVLAAVGAAVCFIRRSRLPMALALTGAFFALAFVLLPESRLWNVRLLPFYYISIYITAMTGLGEIVRAAVEAAAGLTRRLKARHKARQAEPGDPLGAQAESRPASARIMRWITGGSALAATAALIVMVGLPLRGLPGGGLDKAGAYQWGPFRTQALNLGSYWLEYNYRGYEFKEPTAAGGGTPEYQHLVQTMEHVGEAYGCGASLWEYEAGRLGSYGTPMAPMLLPYWTNRCIGSMEGLYFEASATTPYHFLMQSELSQSPSRAQRDLPYSGLDTAAGVEHLRLMGVRYYLAFSDEALRGARASPGLTEIAVSGPWAVFLVNDSEPVIGLTDLPVVVDDLPPFGEGWITPAVGAFVAKGGPWLLAPDGPSDWPRMTLASLAGPQAVAVAGMSEQAGRGERERAMLAWAEVLASSAPRQPVGRPVRVSHVERDTHTVSFSVDRTGAPVLVRTSYFPNWRVSGAEGPYRVTPNLMVVVPTDTEVTLYYSRSGVELFSLLVTLSGLVAAGWLTWRLRPSEFCLPASHTSAS